MKVYNNPKYYSIAFSFRNISMEVDFFEYLIKKYSKRKVNQILEIASGTSPYLEELSSRGYKYTGIDLNPSMLNYVRKEALSRGIEVSLLRANLIDFKIKNYKADLVFVLLGSLYVESDKDTFDHLDCVSNVLAKGCLYVLCEIVTKSITERMLDTWTIQKDLVKVTTSYKAKVVDEKNQTQMEYLSLEVDDNGHKRKISSQVLHKYFKEKELNSLIEKHGKFEIVGEYTNFNKKEENRFEDNRPILVLRKL